MSINLDNISNLNGKQPVIAVIMAAGSGNRFGDETPKQFKYLGHKPLFLWSYDVFNNHPGIHKTCLIVHPDHKERYGSFFSDLNIFEGGNSRKESVYNALNILSHVEYEGKILIHDAARPFIRSDDVTNMIDELEHSNAATLTMPISDSLRHSETGAVSRDSLFAVQTPQGFDFDTLWQAHSAFREKDSFTDDASIVEEYGCKVTHVQGHSNNFKITTQQDWMMAEALINSTYETRTGMGFDVHAFNVEPSEAIRLGGIDIPFEKSLKGHSDADVALHALTDAILGAFGGSDIGQLFPPSDPQWKGTDSALFLTEAVKILQSKGGVLVNIDLTLICEVPKIGPHRANIIKRLSSLLDLSENRISLKATTTEQLGFTGRKEGIAAQAIATIRIPASDD